jgi:hypothetical protein
MAQFHDCIASAAAQGAMSREEADLLRAMYDAQVKATGDDLAAKAKVVEQLTAEAELRARHARLSAERADAIATAFEEFRGPDGKADAMAVAMGVLDNRNNRLLGMPSVTGRRDAIVGYAHGRLEEVLYTFRRKAGTGFRRGAALLDDMVKAAFGENVGDVKARDFLAAWQTVADELVDRANAAGMSIAKLANYLPQNHDAGKMMAVAKDEWVAFIMPRLDISKMTDPLTGGPLTPARVVESLRVIYDRIVTDGAIDMQPSRQAQGRGALANQRQEHRFLVFKDATAWRDYNQAFGNGDIYAALMSHIHGLAKDIAALEVLGPNPHATVTWMKQVVEGEIAKAQLGQPTLWNGAATARMEGRTDAIDRLWNVVNGSVGTGNQNAADAFQAVRNVLTAAQLAGTALTAVLGDPFQQRNAKVFAGIPTLRFLADLPKQLFDGASKRDITRAGVVLQDAMDVLTTDMRGRTLANRSAELTKWLPDRVFQWTGLSPWTTANRRSQAMSFMFEAGDRLGQSLEEMAADGARGERFARWLQGFGIGEAEWAIIRNARPADHGEAGGLLRMMDIWDSAPGDRAVQEAALRYGDAVHAFMEEAVPMGTATTRAMLGRSTRAGTVAGEAVRNVTMYLSYPASVMLSLIRAAQHEMTDGGMARGGLYTAGSLVSLTIGGALVLQMTELRNGRDPRDVTDWTFWAMALAKGGALGYYGDYVLGDYTRGSSQQVAKLAGPVANTAGDLLAATIGGKDIAGALTGEAEFNRGRRLVDVARRTTPLLNMWQIKPVTDRLIWDRLTLLADPNAHRQWRTKERQLMREEGQGVWWGRGEAEPRRAPDFSTLWQ